MAHFKCDYANVNHLIWRSKQFHLFHRYCKLLILPCTTGYATCRCSSGLVPSQICTCGLLIAQNIGFQYISQARRAEQPRRAWRFKAHAMTVAPRNDPFPLPSLHASYDVPPFLHSESPQHNFFVVWQCYSWPHINFADDAPQFVTYLF